MSGFTTLGTVGFRRRRSAEDGGFTLIELLAVIAIILLLMTLLLPAMSGTWDLAYRTMCTSNMRQIQAGYLARAADMEGLLPGAETGFDAESNNWVRMQTNKDSLESIQAGSIWPYVQDVTVYRCPKHPFKHYFRHYSVNDYLGGTLHPNWGYTTVAKALGAVPIPSSTWAFVEEPDPRNYLMGSWVIYLQPGRIDDWIDPVGFWHQGGANFSFCDGHVEYWRWEDARTLLIRYSFWQTTPNSPDIRRVKRSIAPGEPAYKALYDIL
jgi:prepilin-type processing-associated H-X9-DG protein/prepilin-type N-terminal cleavage/methylation domain-containing protein